MGHADWSVAPAKRWVAAARREPDDRYLAAAPHLAGPAAGLSGVFGPGVADEGVTALLGFDFPIGLPLAYAAKAEIEDFRAALPRFGSGRWVEFFVPARTEGEIALERPFFPAGAGVAGNAAKLGAALELTRGQLLRACDRAHAGRRAAAALFLTQGRQQAGKAAIVGWRDVLQPSLRGEGPPVRLWPFDGLLPDLLDRGGLIVAEAYPGEFYGHLGLGIRSAGGKGSREARRAQAPLLVGWAAACGVDLAPDLRAAIDDGFGGPAGEDRFDAVVGLFGMLGVLRGRRPPFEPEAGPIRRIEGWMLGLAAGAGSIG